MFSCTFSEAVAAAGCSSSEARCERGLAERGNPHDQCINNRLPMRPKPRKPPAVVRYFRKVFPRPSDVTSAHPIYKRLCINSLKVNTTTHVTNINSEKPLLIIDRLTLLPKIIV